MTHAPLNLGPSLQKRCLSSASRTAETPVHMYYYERKGTFLGKVLHTPWLKGKDVSRLPWILNTRCSV